MCVLGSQKQALTIFGLQTLSIVELRLKQLHGLSGLGRLSRAHLQIADVHRRRESALPARPAHEGALPLQLLQGALNWHSCQGACHSVASQSACGPLDTSFLVVYDSEHQWRGQLMKHYRSRRRGRKSVSADVLDALQNWN